MDALAAVPGYGAPVQLSPQTAYGIRHSAHGTLQTSPEETNVSSQVLAVAAPVSVLAEAEVVRVLVTLVVSTQAPEGIDR